MNALIWNGLLASLYAWWCLRTSGTQKQRLLVTLLIMGGWLPAVLREHAMSDFHADVCTLMGLLSSLLFMAGCGVAVMARHSATG